MLRVCWGLGRRLARQVLVNWELVPATAIRELVEDALKGILLDTDKANGGDDADAPVLMRTLRPIPVVSPALEWVTHASEAVYAVEIAKSACFLGCEGRSEEERPLSVARPNGV